MPLFQDRELRRALSMGVDRAAMVKNVFGDAALPAIGPLTRALSTYDSTVRPLPFDTAAAARIIARHAPVKFSILVPTSSSTRMRYATLLQAQYARLGVSVSIDALEVNAFLQRVSKGDFDAVLNGWHTDPLPAAVLQAWGGHSLPPNGANFTAYANASFDADIDSASATFDQARAGRLYSRAYGTIDADAPAVWLYEPPTVAGISRRVTVAGMRPDSWWADLADWTIAAN